MNITHGVENSFNGGKNRENACLRDEPAPLACPPTSPPPPLHLFFPPFFLPVSSPVFWSATWEHLCTAAAMGTDKPALMKMNVPTWSPIEFHYEVYLSGAGSQAPGSVLLGSLQACCGETPVQPNLSGAALPQPGPCREKRNDSCFLSLSFRYVSLSLSAPPLPLLSNWKASCHRSPSLSILSGCSSLCHFVSLLSVSSSTSSKKKKN